MWGTTNYSVSSPKFLHRQVQWAGAVCHLVGYACYAYSPDTIKHMFTVCPRQVTHKVQFVNVNKFCSTLPPQKQVLTACGGQNLMWLHCYKKETKIVHSTHIIFLHKMLLLI